MSFKSLKILTCFIIFNIFAIITLILYIITKQKQLKKKYKLMEQVRACMIIKFNKNLQQIWPIVKLRLFQKVFYVKLLEFLERFCQKFNKNLIKSHTGFGNILKCNFSNDLRLKEMWLEMFVLFCFSFTNESELQSSFFLFYLMSFLSNNLSP